MEKNNTYRIGKLDGMSRKTDRVGLLKADRTTRLIFRTYHPKSWYLQALDRHFRAPKSPRKMLGISGVHRCHRLLSPHPLWPCRRDILDKKRSYSMKWITPKVSLGSPNGDRISQRLINPCVTVLGDGSFMIY